MKNDATTKYRSKKLTTLKLKKESTIRKMEADGWELTEVVDGKLQTKLHFRKPVKPISMKIAIPAAIGAVALVAAIGIQSVLQERPEQGGSVAVSQSQSNIPSPVSSEPHTSLASAERPEGSHSSIPSATQFEAITPENNLEFAQILNSGADCSSNIADFASEYDGRIVQFNGSIVYIANVGDYETVKDVLIHAGDYNKDLAAGPNFKFESIQPAVSMHFPEEDPAESIYVGQNLHFEAEIESFDQNSCLFYLNPIKTTSR